MTLLDAKIQTGAKDTVFCAWIQNGQQNSVPKLLKKRVFSRLFAEKGGDEQNKYTKRRVYYQMLSNFQLQIVYKRAPTEKQNFYEY